MKVNVWTIAVVLMASAVAGSLELAGAQESGGTAQAPNTKMGATLSVKAGVDRVVVLGGKTYLRGRIKNDGGSNGVSSALKIKWSKESGPGDVAFEDSSAAVTSATFSALGDYSLKLTASSGELISTDKLQVKVQPAAGAQHLETVDTRRYQINSPLWNDRIKALIVHWIPHCYTAISDLKLKEGGIANLIEAGKKLRGEPAVLHVGHPFANAWVYNTLEAMCLAQMVDPQGEREVQIAQEAMRAKIDEWIPIILAAQEPDGYLQTRFTLGTAKDKGNPPEHWSPRGRGEHEGYVAGYFLEAAIAHYNMTDGKDRRLYDAAKKLADCWCENIGPPPKKTWYDGHQEMEIALVRFVRLVNQVDGSGSGDKYLELAKFLIDSRRDGSPYDQSHLPAVQQYEAVGHSVRAGYFYSGVADIAMLTHDQDYQSAACSLCDNIVDKKYYITGGIGSGETSEGFGPNYSLRNNAYCESCSGIAELFFQYRMNLMRCQARFADLYEETLYNAILGDIDLAGDNFYYQNPLETAGRPDSHQPERLVGFRTAWHSCPCCVSNISRTLLMLPTWMYAIGPQSLYVNLFAGSTVDVGQVAGTKLQVVQETKYPWDG
ncbi:MAG TPA: beta-L-arabinofuranosidase domain-containing protein, partial [Pirellulales bacterium]